MSRRYWIILVCLLLVAVGLEVAVQISHTSRSRVTIINSGSTPIENLVVSYAGSKVSLGGLPAGETAHAHLSAGQKGTLDLAFTQSGNPMQGFQVTDFDPQAFRRDGLEQVLVIQTNQVTRYLDDAGSTTPVSRLWERIRDWVSSEVDASRL